MADKFNWFYAIFKRGDAGQSCMDYRDGMLVTYYDPDIYNPAIDQQEHMQKVFLCVRVSKNFLPYFKQLLIPNRDLDVNPFKSKADEDAFRISGGLVNYDEVGKALGITDIASKVRTKNGIAVIDTSIQAVDWSKLLKSSAVLNPAVEDKMLVTAGDYTIGSNPEDDYASPTVAYADVGSVAVGATLTFTHTTTTADTTIAIFNKKIEGTFNHDGANLQYTNSSDSNILSQTHSVGSTGNVNMYRLNIIGTGTLTANRVFYIHGVYLTGTFSAWGCRFNGNNNRYIGMSLPGLANYKIFDCIIKDCDNGASNSTGITISTGTPASFVVENCIIDKVAYCINNASYTMTFTDCVFLNSRISNILSATGSTSNNCATDKPAVGAAIDNNAKVNIVVATEFVNTDITNMTTGYRLNFLTCVNLYATGATPTIAANTADIYGQKRPGTGGFTSIGVHEPAVFSSVSILPVSGDITGGTTVTATDPGYGFGGAFTVTVQGAAGTLPTVVTNQVGTFVTPAGTAGTADVVFTGIDGDTITLAAGYLYTGGTPVVAPVAAFYIPANPAKVNTEIPFTDLSTGPPTTWIWDFGDAALSYIQHPTHTYTMPGTYTVSLTVGNDLGTSSTYTVLVIITADSIQDLSGSGTVEVLWKKPNREPYHPQRDWEHNVEVYQHAEGITRIHDISSHTAHIYKALWTQMDKSEEYELLAFFVSRKGRYENFWLPQWQNVFKLYDNIHAWDSTIRVHFGFFEATFQGYERFFIELTDGSLITRHVVSVVDNGDDTETFHLESMMDRTITQDDIVYFGRLVLTRFDQDEIEFEHHTTDYSDCNLMASFLELTEEYVKAGGQS